jgi:TPR repeat protein
MKVNPLQFLVRSSGVSVLAAFLALVSAKAEEQAFTVQTAQAAAEKGDPKAEYFLGRQYAKGNGVPKDDMKAADYFRKAADQGLAAAQNDLGAFYAGPPIKTSRTLWLPWARCTCLATMA